MEKVLKMVMPWLSAPDVGELGRTCRAMAEAARCVTERRVGDATQGWETIAVPIENQVDDCLYPSFEYTPFSRLASPTTGNLFGGPWGGEEVEVEGRRRGLSESKFGGAMVTGSVLIGPGIGCRCPNDCSLESHTFSDRWSLDCFPEEDVRGTELGWAGRSNCAVARRDPRPESPERLEERLKKKSRFEGHTGDQLSTCGALYDQFTDQESFEEAPDAGKMGSPNKQSGVPVEASSCACGRYMGGELAYDSNSRLHIQHPNIQMRPAMAEQVGSSDSELLEENVNSMQMDGRRALVEVDQPPLVMECGQACACTDLCKYRVSQRGLAVRAKVVRTSFKGWGLWALQEIKQGSFVCEYAGELVTTLKARERQKLYDSEEHGKHWQGSALLTVREHLPSGQASVRVNVDATRIGNVARFINHSCDGGNLIPCLIRTAGCIIPKLALFARTDISNGEELTYSYGTADVNAETSKPCFCGTSACLGRLPNEST